MRVPPEFQDFCRRFHQDAFFPGVSEAIGAVLKSFDDRQKKVLEDFILSLIDNDAPNINAGTQLKRLWQKNNSDHWIGGGAKGAKEFFREVLNQLTDSKQAE
jgi:hypothetical protein